MHINDAGHVHPRTTCLNCATDGEDDRGALESTATGNKVRTCRTIDGIEADDPHTRTDFQRLNRFEGVRKWVLICLGLITDNQLLVGSER
jgi:hypothetical protein